MSNPVRFILTIVAPVVGVFAGLMTREWRDHILHAFPFYWGTGPISWRAIAFWGLVLVAMGSAAWSYIAQWRDKAATDDADASHDEALELTVSRSDDVVSLWITNRGTHSTTDIEISAVPDDWGPQKLPSVAQDATAGVQLTYPILGAWFLAKVTQLDPGRGLRLCEASLTDSDFTRFDFDVSWNDHERKQRKICGSADLQTTDREIVLTPRPKHTAAA